MCMRDEQVISQFEIGKIVIEIVKYIVLLILSFSFADILHNSYDCDIYTQLL